MSLKKLVEEVAKLEVSDEEKVATLTDAAMSMGFEATLDAELSKVAGTTKTASTVKTVAGSEVRFDKMTVEDLIGHLSAQYGRPEQKEAAEKTAGTKTAREKFAGLLKAELARPT